jgi:hypothetical protein
MDIEKPFYPGQSIVYDFGIVQIKRAYFNGFHEEGVIVKIYSEYEVKKYAFEVRNIFANPQGQILGPDDSCNVFYSLKWGSLVRKKN